MWLGPLENTGSRWLPVFSMSSLSPTPLLLHSGAPDSTTLRKCSSLRANSAHPTPVNKLEPPEPKRADLNQMGPACGCQGFKLCLKADSPGPSGRLKGFSQPYEAITGARRLDEPAVAKLHKIFARPTSLSAMCRLCNSRPLFVSCHLSPAYC